MLAYDKNLLLKGKTSSEKYLLRKKLYCQEYSFAIHLKCILINEENLLPVDCICVIGILPAGPIATNPFGPLKRFPGTGITLRIR
jgi:hypothetical protein